MSSFLIHGLKKRWIRIRRREYWPTLVYYFPVLPYYLYRSMQLGSLFMYAKANPGIEHGGMVMESKWDIHQGLSDEYYPKTLLFDQNSNRAEWIGLLSKKPISYPLMVKPVYGFQGKGVKLVFSEPELDQQLRNMQVPVLVQEFVPYERELGVFCVRKSSGKIVISDIVEKIPIKVCGDGYKTVEALIMQEERYLFHQEFLRKYLPNIELQEVLPMGKTKVLLPIGNHARGARFQKSDAFHTPLLTSYLEEALKGMQGFNYGRLDLKFTDEKSLQNGQFKIIEINGSGSEPGSIYDPNLTMIEAWRMLLKHVDHMYACARQNSDFTYTSKDFFRMINSYKKYKNKLHLL